MSQCAICSDLSDGVERVMAAPCGHVFHTKCLSRWLSVGRTCPECRKDICLDTCMDLYFNISSTEANLRIEVENLKSLLQEKCIEVNDVLNKNKKLQKVITHHEATVNELLQENTRMENQCSNSMTTLKELQQAIQEKIELRKEIIELKKNRCSELADMEITIQIPGCQVQELQNAAIEKLAQLDEEDAKAAKEEQKSKHTTQSKPFKKAYKMGPNKSGKKEKNQLTVEVLDATMVNFSALRNPVISMQFTPNEKKRKNASVNLSEKKKSRKSRRKN